MEETGCKAKIEGEVGAIIEFRDNIEQIQISYCFLAKATPISQTNFSKKEEAQGFLLKWVDLDEAINLVENSKPDNYVGKFIVKRDALFLRKVYKLISH